VSPSIRQLVGYEPGELIGKSAFLVVAPEHHAIVQDAFRDAVAGGGTTRNLDYYLLSKDGSKRWFETHARAIIDEEGRIDGVISIVRDIAARKETEKTLTAAALTDSLTLLPNRRAFRLAADKLLPFADVNDGACLAMFDIDHFKRVNDRFGHDAGDIVLCRFAQIAQSLVRSGDLVARMGGEEFAILFPHTSAEYALVICERLRVEVAATCIMVEGARISVTVSGGVAALGEDGLDRALKIADQALYVAKEQGRDQLALAA
jgi:diguanylate cyclase (GGDEF)-like protein/PAS domain S-box-containing protein